jgi:hypothetical protein
MFDYSYWPEDLNQELKKQMKNFTHKAQILMDGESFLGLGNDILKAQMSDKFFELIVFLPKGFRTLEIANLLHMIVQGGANVGIFEVQIIEKELERYGIFDNKVLMSDKLHALEGGVFPLILQKHSDFQRIMEKSLPVHSSAQELNMKFIASKYFVAKGEQVELSWRVENGNVTRLNPGNTEVESIGSEVFIIENDTLFTITSRNAKNKSTLSIFIRCLEEEQFELIVSVFNRDLNAYVKIDPISEGEQSFAVYKGDLLRVEWTCPAASSLKELGLGQLKNTGFHNFICLENRLFDFEMSLFNGNFKKQLRFFPFNEEGDFANISSEEEQHITRPYLPEESKSPNKWMNWIKRLVSVLKINRNNERV